MVSRDLALHWTIRLLSSAALVLFLYALLRLDFPAFIGAIWAGAMTYLLIRVDVERHPTSRDEDLRVDDTEEPATDGGARAMYPLQAAGIPLTYERRSRRARKKGG
ncbi:MAG: hypothetical protein E6K10_06240 [Methanobacteriota archaeon]|nr:MAG: hypothetical protein E6K10_06240 [Euryarchaeota archaeon]